MKKLFIITASFGMLFLMGCQKVTITPNESLTGAIEEITGYVENITGSVEETGFTIQSFEDCLNAGFPIMESYPRQCNDGKTTYVEEITQILTGEETGGDNTTGQQIGESKQEDSKSTNLSILQQKLRAMMERRNQQIQSGNTTNSGTTNTTTQTTTTTSSNEQVTEEDIENLENIIDAIVEK